jgi:hypothetical protein
MVPGLACTKQGSFGQTVSGDGFDSVIVNYSATVRYRHRVQGGVTTAARTGCHIQEWVHCLTWTVALDGLAIVVVPFRMTAELSSKFARRDSGSNYVLQQMAGNHPSDGKSPRSHTLSDGSPVCRDRLVCSRARSGPKTGCSGGDRGGGRWCGEVFVEVVCAFSDG